MKKSIKLLMVAMIIVILAASVGGTLAYIVTSTDPVENTFTPEQVTCEIGETFNKEAGQKSSVTVTNTSKIPVYIRVALIPYWVDSNNNVAGVPSWTVPNFNLGSDWVKGSDGYYYYKKEVAAGGTTSSLVAEGSVIQLPANDTNGNKAALTIAAEAIQSQGGAVTVGANGGWTIADPNAN